MPRDAPPAPAHQRADGALDLVLGAGPGGAVLRRLDQRAPLRALVPAPEPGDPKLVTLLNCGGGLAGGDALRLDVTLEAGAAATLATAAAEKVYRSLGPATTIATALTLHGDSAFEWLPQESILFDGARLDRRMTVRLAPEARLLAVEILVFGRAAYGERMRQGRVHDAWRVHGPDGLRWADALALSGDIGARLAAPFGAAGAAATGMLLLATPDAAAHRDALRARPGHAMGGATVPAPGLLLARWLGEPGAVRGAVADAVLLLRAAALGRPPRLPRPWTI